MSLGTAAVLYLLIGVGVAVAVASRGGRGRAEVAFRALAAVPFWPLFVPLLLSPAEARQRMAAGPPQDELGAAIAQADAELAAALGSLGGWAEHALSGQLGRIEELRAAWDAQAERVREMDRLLSLPEPGLPAPAGAEATAAAERRRQIEEARRQNRERLRQLRGQAYEDLLGSLARVREVASLIHLAKFTGAPAARAEELVAGIAAAVEGIPGLGAQPNRDSQQIAARPSR
jgi:hypothetical protein